jgi:ribosomal protein S18 acetylase RimI-like enzyme/predicted double-glycine peptidase
MRNSPHPVPETGIGHRPPSEPDVATTPAGRLRAAVGTDLEELLRLEALAFSHDRLSRRSFRRWLRHQSCVFLVGDDPEGLCGYILVILRRGTRLARLYSLAVDPACRGRGLASLLISAAELAARQRGSLHMRLEVAQNNEPAITLYQKLGYRQFGLYRHYYEDSSDALRLEKPIHVFQPRADSRAIPWLAQTTEFTCGPAALMMAMAGLDKTYCPSPQEEVQIWREATTVFMTSGHGGCHPVGLALAAAQRGFSAEVMVSQPGPLFVDGVRSDNKKRVLCLVHDAFLTKAREQQIPVTVTELDQQQLCDCFAAGANVLILISTYRLDSKKAPHWVVLSGHDETCLYVHDPELPDDDNLDIARASSTAIDCQHVPIAKVDFSAMSRFGANRLQTAVILWNQR